MKKMFFLPLAVLVCLSSKIMVAQDATLQTAANLANDYCIRVFPVCYINQYYKGGVVNKAYMDTNTSLYMEGIVNYTDYYGFPHSEYFNARFVVTATAMEVYFQKFNTMLGAGYSYWEPCNRYFPYQQQQVNAYVPPSSGASSPASTQTFIENCLYLNQKLVNTMGKW